MDPHVCHVGGRRRVCAGQPAHLGGGAVCGTEDGAALQVGVGELWVWEAVGVQVEWFVPSGGAVCGTEDAAVLQVGESLEFGDWGLGILGIGVWGLL